MPPPRTRRTDVGRFNSADARTFQALHEIAVAVGALRDFDELAQCVIRHACDLLGGGGAVLDVFDERAGVVREVSSFGSVNLFPAELRLGQGIAGQAAVQRKVVLVNEYPTWEHAVPQAVEHGVCSALAAPLLVADRLIGVLAVHFFSPQKIVSEQAEVLSLLAAQVAPALDVAQLHAADARRYEREKLLREMSRSLASDLDEHHVLELAARHAAELVEAPFARIWLAQEDGTLRCSAGVGGDRDDIGQSLPADSLTGKCWAEDRAMRVDNVATSTSWRSWDDFLDRTMLRAYLGVPIHRADGILGVVVAMRPAGAPFFDDDERLQAGLADAIAVALGNARALGRLAESEHRLRTSYEAIACGVIVQDKDGVILHANSAAEEVFGYTLQQMRGRSSTDLWKVVDEDGVERPPTGRNVLIVARTGKAARNFTTCIVPPNGRRRWLQCNAVPIRADDGSVHVVSSFIDISDRKRVEEAIAHQARHDALTGLPNRSLLGERLSQAIVHAESTDATLGLLLMDLDHFKEVNDTLGHHAGDALLQQVAERLREVVRGSDTVARLGGDEFAILLPGMAAEDAMLVASKVLESLRAPLKLEGQAVAIGGSVGVAVYPTHGDDANTLLRRADVAMYVAKRSDLGACVYSAAQDYYAPDRLALLPQLREAIDHPTDTNHLVLHYQPKVDLHTKELVGAEALVRWEHPRHGLVGPDRFVPLAEQTAMARALSQWVLETALRQVHFWATRGYGIPVAVNLSMRDLQDPQLPEALEALLVRFHVPGTQLSIEITESTLMAEPERALDVLRRLRAMGVRVAIDDFGTGYSSLAYLKRLPVHELKVDRSFVHDLHSNPSDRAIVRSVVDLAHNLGLQVVAEGVEDERTWRLLEGLGCDFAQGYMISQPLPASEFEGQFSAAHGKAA